MVKMKSQKARNREIEREILRLLNKERKKRGLKELQSEPYLIQAARKHSEDMIKRHYFSHEGKGGLKVRIGKSLYKYNQKRNKKLREHYKKNKTFLYKIRKFFGYIPKAKHIYSSGYAGENIAIMSQGVNVKGIGYVKSEKDVAKALMKTWMKSPGHRSNILNPAFTEIGIGVACNKKQGYREYYATQDFQD